MAVKSPLYLTKNLSSGQLNPVLWRWHVGLLSQKEKKNRICRLSSNNFRFGLMVKHEFVTLRRCQESTRDITMGSHIIFRPKIIRGKHGPRDSFRDYIYTACTRNIQQVMKYTKKMHIVYRAPSKIPIFCTWFES